MGPDWVFEHGLCTEAILGVAQPDASGGSAITPERFRENPAFVQLLQGLIAEHLGEVHGIVREAARQRGGHVYLIDGRTPRPDGQVPPLDVIGAVAVEAGLLVPGSYRHNPNHRLLTEDGFFVLPTELEAVLHDNVEARRTR
jgi:hypothetical protein